MALKNGNDSEQSELFTKKALDPRMILSGIQGFKVWIPDYTLGNDSTL